ncbi:MAG: sodium:glutamate symporter [spirochete symbiont of Stewartia floridana]|nr:MAG: sodium:glutamate symporter [spirochete symbiont of Stewartia floridana]
MSIIGAALLLTTWIRARIRFFQRYLVPNALTAGFILFPLYNWVFGRIGMDTENLKNIVFHFLNLSFIAMTLRVSIEKRRSNRDVFATSTMVLSQYVIQSFLGTVLTIIMIKTFFPNLFPGFGLFATLGFSLGPGQAFTIGTGWETMGFEGLGSVGLTFGALGFIWACFGGIFLVNLGIRKGWISREELTRFNKDNVKSGLLNRGETGDYSKIRNITNPEAIDPMSFSSALVFFTYLLSFLGMKGISALLALIGSNGVQLATNLWGIMFIFCGLTAMAVKSVLRAVRIEYVIDNHRMSRISGFSVDFMVAAAIAAISAAVITHYLVPLLIIAGMVGLATTFSHIWLSSRVFQDHVFFRAILVYGAATGTLPTGLALLRIIDPQLETPASRDFMLSAGFTFLMAIPILLTANLPAMGALKGSLTPTYQVLGLYALYIVACAAAYILLSGRRRFKDYTAIWFRRHHSGS